MQVDRLSENGYILRMSDEINIEVNNLTQNLLRIIKKKYGVYLSDIYNTYNEICVIFKSNCRKKALLNEITKLDSSPVKDSREIYYIPVHYGHEFSPDLSEMAENLNMKVDELLYLHYKKIYKIYFIGFLPCFPYLSGVDERIRYGRKKTPRLRVEKGSVGIANDQTGIYTVDSPGGWQIIGKTPVDLFVPESNDPFKIVSGNYIKFYPVGLKEFYFIRQLSDENRFWIHSERILGY